MIAKPIHNRPANSELKRGCHPCTAPCIALHSLAPMHAGFVI